MSTKPGIQPLSLLAWGGGAATGAAYASNHRLAGAALGAMLIGAFSDVLIERRQLDMPIGMAAVTGAAVIGGIAYLLRDNLRGNEDR
jgi:hypothetical protein